MSKGKVIRKDRHGREVVRVAAWVPVELGMKLQKLVSTNESTETAEIIEALTKATKKVELDDN